MAQADCAACGLPFPSTKATFAGPRLLVETGPSFVQLSRHATDRTWDKNRRSHRNHATSVFAKSRHSLSTELWDHIAWLFVMSGSGRIGYRRIGRDDAAMLIGEGGPEAHPFCRVHIGLHVEADAPHAADVGRVMAAMHKQLGKPARCAAGRGSSAVAKVPAPPLTLPPLSSRAKRRHNTMPRR